VVSKAGYAGAWSLLVLVPVINLAAFYLLAGVSIRRFGWPASDRSFNNVMSPHSRRITVGHTELTNLPGLSAAASPLLIRGVRFRPPVTPIRVCELADRT
jgi:hypothetical protein